LILWIRSKRSGQQCGVERLGKYGKADSLSVKKQEIKWKG